MSKHEIEIEGLPDGWEPIAVAVPGEDEKIWTSKGVVSTVSAIHCEPALIVRRKVRKYDLSKTLNDVLVRNGHGHLMRHGDCTHPTRWLSDLWQPNIHGKCPVDPEACIVQVILADGTITERLADKLVWEKAFLKSTIVSWRFVRLADNVEW